MPHPGLGREMNDAGEVGVALDQAEDALAVGNVKLRKREPRIGLQPGEARLLQRHVVVIVKVINSQDPFTAIKQRLGNMKADEPGGTREKNRHLLSYD